MKVHKELKEGDARIADVLVLLSSCLTTNLPPVTFYTSIKGCPDSDVLHQFESVKTKYNLATSLNLIKVIKTKAIMSLTLCTTCTLVTLNFS